VKTNDGGRQARKKRIIHHSHGRRPLRGSVCQRQMGVHHQTVAVLGHQMSDATELCFLEEGCLERRSYGLGVARDSRGSRRLAAGIMFPSNTRFQIFGADATELQLPKKTDHGVVDLAGAFLLGPVAATGEYQSAAELRHEVCEVSDEVIHAAERHDKITLASDIEGRDTYTTAGKGSEEFPVVVQVPIPVQTAAESRACEFLHIEVDSPRR